MSNSPQSSVTLFSSPSPPLATSSKFKRRRDAARPIARLRLPPLAAVPQPATTLVLPSGQHIDLLSPSPFESLGKGQKFPPAQLAILEAAYDAVEKTVPAEIRSVLPAYLSITKRRLSTWIEGKRRAHRTSSRSGPATARDVVAKDEPDQLDVQSGLVHDPAALVGLSVDDDDDVLVTRAPKRRRIGGGTSLARQTGVDIWETRLPHVPMPSVSLPGSSPLSSPVAYTPSPFNPFLVPSARPLSIKLPARSRTSARRHEQLPPISTSPVHRSVPPSTPAVAHPHPQLTVPHPFLHEDAPPAQPDSSQSYPYPPALIQSLFAPTPIVRARTTLSASELISISPRAAREYLLSAGGQDWGVIFGG